MSSACRCRGFSKTREGAMTRKLLLSVSALGLAVAAAMWAAPQVGAQVFVGTPAPQQFAGQGQPSTRNGEWPTNGGDLAFTRYSPLDQINAQNFDKLEVAWRFKTDAFGPFPEYKLEGTPIMIKGVLYTTAGTRRSVIALDGKTGELIWSHSVREGERAANSARQLSGRGVSYWTDVRGGKQIWRFNTIPRPGEFGSETWENNSWAINGNTGVWSHITADEELGLVYIPVETPTSDYYGGHRPGNNLFAESLVAVDLKTGVRKWHFQFVHHPIWNYDISSAPLLADITVNGQAIKAVAVPSKEAFLYVFDRVTGKPVWPIEERPVPQSDVPGEKTSATQ